MRDQLVGLRLVNLKLLDGGVEGRLGVRLCHPTKRFSFGADAPYAYRLLGRRRLSSHLGSARQPALTLIALDQLEMRQRWRRAEQGVFDRTG